MRRATHDTQVLRSDDGTLLGVNLGWDFVSEHEWGIQGLKTKFGVPTTLTRKNAGVVYRTATSVPSHHLVQVKGIWGLVVGDRVGNLESHIPYGGQEMSASWDEKELVVFHTDHPRVTLELANAFAHKDILVGFSVAKAFGNSGLTLVVASRIPREIADALRAADLDSMALKDAATATGIAVRLKAYADTQTGYGCAGTYYALSPRWAKDFPSKTTQYPVVYWLNPQGQDKHNFGYFTVEDLDQWIVGKGPIPKTCVEGEST